MAASVDTPRFYDLKVRSQEVLRRSKLKSGTYEEPFHWLLANCKKPISYTAYFKFERKNSEFS